MRMGSAVHNDELKIQQRERAPCSHQNLKAAEIYSRCMSKAAHCQYKAAEQHQTLQAAHFKAKQKQH